VADRKAFLLRLDPATLRALQRWAGDDLRSVNGQIEWILRRALAEAGRHASPDPGGAAGAGGGDDPGGVAGDGEEGDAAPPATSAT
jgi:hypothetical protein